MNSGHQPGDAPLEVGRVAFISIGSNLGDTVATVRRAFVELQKISDGLLRCSSLWQTTPVDCPPDSPEFINAVVALEPRPEETPESLLAHLQELELLLGRRPKVVLNEPRQLDLDLISFKLETRDTATLTLPHPRFSVRRFVLAPLDELAPEAVLPGQSHPVARLLAALDTDDSAILHSPHE